MAGNFGGYGNAGTHMAPIDPRSLFTHKGPNTPVAPGTTTGPTIDRASFDVRVVQQPEDALVTVSGKEKSRKPIDPPPIYQIELYRGVDPQKHFYRNPYVFGSVTLIYEDKDEPYRHNGQDPLTGTLVSSLHCLKNHDNKEGGFFIFGDVSVKVVGRFRLRFSIHEVVPDDCAWYLGGAISEPFEVSLPKDYRGLKESTYLSRAFSDQGVRLRLRKDTRGGAGMKRGPPDDEGQNDRDAKRQHKSPSFPHSLSTIPVPAPRLAAPVAYYPNFTTMAPRLPSSVPQTQPYSMYTMANSQNSYMNPGMSHNLPYMPNNAARYPSNNMPSQGPPNTNPQSSPNASSQGPTNSNPYSSSNMPNDNWPNNMGGDGSGYPWTS